MLPHFDRLRRGERWWPAEIALRAVGLMLLGGCFELARLAHRMVTAPPPHQATLGEFAVCAAIVVALTGGIAFTFFGPGLLEEVPIARSSAYFAGTRPL